MMGIEIESDDLERVSDIRDVEKSIFIITEGKTELDYIGCINDYGFLNESHVIEIYSKEGIDINEADRLLMIELAHNYIELGKIGKLPLYSFVTIIMNDLLNNRTHFVDMGWYDFSSVLYNLRSNFITNNNFGDIVENNIVIRPEELYQEVEDFINSELGIDYALDDTDKLYPDPTEIGPYDEVYVMFDRDYNSDVRTDEMFDGYLSKCSEYGYKPLITTPQFELWLLMHFDFDDYGVMSKYPSCGLRVFRDLEKFDPDAHNKKGMKRRFKLYADKIYHAISESEKSIFCNSPTELCRKAGTNLGCFMREILLSESELNNHIDNLRKKGLLN